MLTAHQQTFRWYNDLKVIVHFDEFLDDVYPLDVTAADDEAVAKKQGVSGYGTELIVLAISGTNTITFKNSPIPRVILRMFLKKYWWEMQYKFLHFGAALLMKVATTACDISVI